MDLTLKLRKYGDSYVLTIPKGLVDAAHLKIGDEFVVKMK